MDLVVYDTIQPPLSVLLSSNPCVERCLLAEQSYHLYSRSYWRSRSTTAVPTSVLKKHCLQWNAKSALYRCLFNETLISHRVFPWGVSTANNGIQTLLACLANRASLCFFQVICLFLQPLDLVSEVDANVGSGGAGLSGRALKLRSKRWRLCVAQRKHSCFPPPATGSNPGSAEILFSLLFSLWTVSKSNPSSA